MRSRHPRSAPPLDDDDLLSEILLRLPPHPSSLPRASAVCRRWYNLASDPAFSRRFRRHHRHNPPLLGCFTEDGNQLRFEPTLDPPNRVPRARFSLPIHPGDCNFTFLGCRHGFLLTLHTSRGTPELLVWDPVNGHEHHIAMPPGFSDKINAAVLRSALGDFQVVLVSTDGDVDQRVIACVYSSETGVWGNLITTPLPPSVSDISPAEIAQSIPAVLVGDALYVLLLGTSSSIIEFNVDRQSLAVIPLPVELGPQFHCHYLVMRAEGGGTGLLFVPTSPSDHTAQLWKKKTDCDGVASWVLGKTIELSNLLSPGLQDKWGIHIQGFAEENNIVFLWVDGTFFMVYLDSLQFKKFKFPRKMYLPRHPFECVYAAGI